MIHWELIKKGSKMKNSLANFYSLIPRDKRRSPCITNTLNLLESHETKTTQKAMVKLALTIGKVVF